MNPTVEIDYSRKWLVMIAVGLGIFLATLDASIVNIALPTLVEELDTTFQIVPWVVISYLLTQSVLTLSVGRLGDMLGKKWIYTSGFVVFTTASALCGFSPTIGWLIGFRVLQGIGAAMTLSLGLAILTEAFPASERGRALGLGGSVVSLGIITGPTAGGYIIDALNWQWIFFVNIPVGILGTLAAWRFVQALPPKGRQKFDYLGAGILLITLSSLLLGLTIAQEAGFDDRLVLGLLAAAAISLALFIFVERRVEQPMIDLAIFENRAFTTSLVTGLFTFVAIAGVLILSPFYLEQVLGLETRIAGLLLAASPVALTVLSPLSGWLSDKLGSRPITIVGLVVLALGYSLVQTLTATSSPWSFVFIILTVASGMAIFQSPNNSVIMGSVRQERLGIASGMLAETRIVGQVTGIGVLTTIWAARTAVREEAMPLADAQAAAFGDVGIVSAVLMVIALGVAIWGLSHERRDRRAALESV